MSIELDGLATRQEYDDLVKENLVKPLTQQEHDQLLRMYDGEKSEEQYARGTYLSVEFFKEGRQKFLKTILKKMANLSGKKEMVINHVGVGIDSFAKMDTVISSAAMNLIALKEFFSTDRRNVLVNTFEGRHEALKELVNQLKELLQNQIPEDFKFYEADLYLHKIHSKADLVIGLNIFGSNIIDTKTNKNHTLFDNLVQGTKKGGYLLVNDVPKNVIRKDGKVLNGALLDDLEEDEELYWDDRSTEEAVEGLDLDAYGLKIKHLTEHEVLFQKVKNRRNIFPFE